MKKKKLNLSKALEFSKSIAFESGKILEKYQKKIGSLTVNYKKAQGVCSEADIMSENYLIKRIKKEYPSHEILAEETSFVNSDISKKDFERFKKAE